MQQLLKKKVRSERLNVLCSQMPKTIEDKSFDVYIRRVLKQIHPDTGITSSAMKVMDRLIKIWAEKIMNAVNKALRNSPKKTVGAREIQTGTRLVIPGELVKHAVSEGVKAVTKFNETEAGGKARQEVRAGLVFSVSRCKSLIRLHSIVNRVSATAPVYFAAVLEYLTAELLEMAGNAARDNRRMRIKPLYISMAVYNDEDFSYLLKGVKIPVDKRVHPPHTDPLFKKTKSKKKSEEY